MTGTLKERFEAKFVIDPESGCWNWTGCKDKTGYGFIRSNGKSIRAYRISWELYKGKIPEHLHILHHCDNPSCVNPIHLFAGTNYDNIRDCISKGRNNIGERNARAKLTRAEVLGIREMCLSGISQSLIAEIYGVSQSCVSRIHTGEDWGHLLLKGEK